jgi:predicted dehydrogenase
MIQVGIAGVGFMGMVHYLSYDKVDGIKVAALSDVNTKRLTGDWTDIKGNFGPAGTMMDLGGIATYENLDEMIADPDLDLVDVCLPPAMHADVVVKALEAGKHVFCEKPMALSVADTQRMVSAAQQADRLLMIGHVLVALPDYNFVHQAAVDGRYGALLGGHFKRVISDPPWLPDFYNPDKVGGPMLDLHIHDAHFIRLLFGMPKALTSRGRMRGKVVEYFSTQFEFDDPSLVVTATSGVINQQGRPFTHGFEVHFEKATILMDFSVIDGKPVASMPCTVLADDDSVEHPEFGDGDPMMDAFVIEITRVAEAVHSGQPAEFLMGDLARDAIIICQKQTESVRTGQRVEL